MDSSASRCNEPLLVADMGTNDDRYLDLTKLSIDANLKQESKSHSTIARENIFFFVK